MICEGYAVVGQSDASVGFNGNEVGEIDCIFVVGLADTVGLNEGSEVILGRTVGTFDDKIIGETLGT